MLCVKPVNELVNTSVPVPSVVILFAIVGFVVNPQQTPLAVTGAPPSLVIFPPLVAVVCAIEDAAVVVRIGTVAGFVVKLISFP